MEQLFKNWLETFKNKQGHFSAREATTFLFVLVIVASWIGAQFFGKQVPEFMFGAFVLIVLSGLGLYTFEKHKDNGSTN